MQTSEPAAPPLAFFSDVEGNMDFFLALVAKCRVLHFVDGKLEFKHPTAHFCFGGDALDKGIGDIRVTQTLIDFKRRNMDRVHLLIGNRDANKLRLGSELSRAFLESDTCWTDAEYPYWLKAGSFPVAKEYLARCNGNKAKARLMWMLNESMGAPDAFELRRVELKLLNKEHGDNDIVQSFVDQVSPTSPNNFSLQYLELGQLAYLHGNILCVHGGLNETNIGVVPKDTYKGKGQRIQHLPEWVNELNGWASRQIIQYKQNPNTGGTSLSRPAFGLLDYTVTGICSDYGLVCQTYLPPKGKGVLQLDEQTKEYMRKASVNTLVVGHTPCGDCPAIVRNDDILVVMADTSYSKPGHKSTAPSGFEYVDNRGLVASNEIFLTEAGVEVQGRSAANTEFHFLVHPGGKHGDPYIGAVVDDALVVYKNANGPKYHAFRRDGFRFAWTTFTAGQIAAKLPAVVG